MSPAFPYLCVLRCAMGTPVDNGGCYFNGEIKKKLENANARAVPAAVNARAVLRVKAVNA